MTTYNKHWLTLTTHSLIDEERVKVSYTLKVISLGINLLSGHGCKQYVYLEFASVHRQAGFFS